MHRYVIRRLLQLVPILLGITLLSFGMMHLAGGDAVTALLENQGVAVTQDVIDAKRHELGLDQPFLVQYLGWLKGLVTGNMGTSYVSGKDVFQTFVSKLPATILLTFSSVLVTVIVAVPLGIVAATKQNRFVDYLIRVLSFVGNSLPNFFVGLLLIYFLALQAGLFPVMSSADNPLSVVLPAVTLAIAMGTAAAWHITSSLYGQTAASTLSYPFWLQAIAIAKDLLDQKLLTPEEYTVIDTKLCEKYGAKFSALICE